MLNVSKENKPNENRFLFVAPITLKSKDYYCEVIVKSNKNRQGFYIHEIELKEKLADVFSTSQQGTSTSSKSIIADLIKKYNPNIKNSKVQFQEDGKQNFDVTVDTIDDVLAKNNLFYEELEQGKEYKVVTTRVGGKLNVQELTFDRIDDKASDYTLVFKDKNGNEIKVTDNQYIYQKTTPIEQSVEAYRT